MSSVAPQFCTRQLRRTPLIVEPFVLAAMILTIDPIYAQLVPDESTLLQRSLGEIEGGNNILDPVQLGWALATGDFNNDGIADLAIGVPGDDVPVDQSFIEDAGGFHILRGSANGLHFNDQAYFDSNTAAVEGIASKGERMGTTLAVGDFDNDGRDDLIVGLPGDAVFVSGQDHHGGSVLAFSNSNSGLRASGSQLINQAIGGMSDEPEHYGGQVIDGEFVYDYGDEFGAALAVGDFDNDGHDDVAIGVPNESVSTTLRAGAVHVVRGAIGGLTSTDQQFWTQTSDGVPGAVEAGDRFGFALASGNFNCDEHDDLAIGVPYEAIGSTADAGAVTVLYGSDEGLTASSDDWYQDGPDIQGGSETSDLFGWSLAAGDFNGDGCDELAIGVPQEDVNGNTVSNGGAVAVLFGSGSGLVAADNQLWTQDNATTRETAQAGDLFGYRLATGDFDGDGRDDLAISAPLDDICDGSASMGVVVVLHGSATGLTAANNQVWDKDRYGVVTQEANYDRLGISLATGDWDNNGTDDLAIGQATLSLRGGALVLYSETERIFHSGMEQDPTGGPDGCSRAP